ncbi:MAG: hypothetical protein IKN56_06890 [Clostridia bacterium]|nr:hypothetical protein [Clostridia bacterium]
MSDRKTKTANPSDVKARIIKTIKKTKKAMSATIASLFEKNVITAGVFGDSEILFALKYFFLLDDTAIVVAIVIIKDIQKSSPAKVINDLLSLLSSR